MNRKLLINCHLYMAALFAPVLLIMGFTGGMYLLGYKGSLEEKLVFQIAADKVNFQQDNKAATVEQLLQMAQIEHSFDSVVGGGRSLMTRPSSTRHYQFKLEDDRVIVLERNPSVLRALIELHKGHGPELFVWMQKIMALALLLILLSGLLLGYLSPVLRRKTLLTSAIGVAAFIGLGFLS
jgi:hypothetical protein